MSPGRSSRACRVRVRRETGDCRAASAVWRRARAGPRQDRGHPRRGGGLRHAVDGRDALTAAERAAVRGEDGHRPVADYVRPGVADAARRIRNRRGHARSRVHGGRVRRRRDAGSCGLRHPSRSKQRVEPLPVVAIKAERPPPCPWPVPTAARAPWLRIGQGRDGRRRLILPRRPR